jgi:dihydroneopterin aldolase
LNGKADIGDNPIEITIEGLEVFAHHGLLPEERELGQTFNFDIYLLLESCPACESDDVAETVNYAAVADTVVEAATGETYLLLEKLAAVIAEKVLAAYPGVSRVGIRAAKPAPPLPHVVESVAVYIERNRGPVG